MKGHPVVAWPPTVIDLTPLGHLRDLSGNKYPRDVGRSSKLSNERVLIQFGDTFCFNASGEFIDLSENTCSLVIENLNPTLSTYSYKHKNEHADAHEPQSLTQLERVRQSGDSKIPPFITRFKDEKDKPGAWTYKYWSFSGIVESFNDRDEGAIRGWTWFQKWAIEQATRKEYFQWTGIAEVEYTGQAGFPTIRTHRKDVPYDERPLFNDWEPSFGSFCAVADEEYVYAYGPLQPQGGTDTSKDVVVARVPACAADKRESYEYYEGTSWVKIAGSGIQYPTRCAPVLKNMQHGQIWRTEVFGSKSPWMFIGCNATGDSQVIFGRSSRPEEPFTTVKLMTADPLVKQPDSAFTYCMYPHPWAFDMARGDLMITWSEGGIGGNIVAVKVRLRMVDDGEDVP